MANVVAKYAAKKVLSGQLKKYQSKAVAGDEDPYYALVEVPGRPGKMKKVKKLVPDYIPENDALLLARARRRAYYLDMSLFNFAGQRFGWSSVIGLIPAVGDFLDLFMALSLVRMCTKAECKLDSATKNQMMFNIVVDFLIGLVPFLGDFCDAWFKCNTKNVRLLEQRLDKVYKPQVLRESDRAVNEATTRTKRRNHPPATVYEDFSDSEGHREL